MNQKTQRAKARNKPKGLLASAIEPRKQETGLLGDIQSHVMKKAANDTSRRQDVIHPSELCKDDVCPRKITYRISGVKKDFDSEVHRVALQTIFQEGHDIHSKWQTWMAEMGDLWGNWKCNSCGLFLERHKAKDLPEYDGAVDEGPIHTHVWEYREVPIDGMEKYLIHGHEDGAFGKHLVEVKSIGLGTLRMEEPALVSQNTVKTTEGKSVVDYDSVWKNLKRPLLGHRKQTGLYLTILQENGEPFEDVIFIYENKANQQVKEFIARPEPHLVEPMLDMAKDIKWAVENGKELPRPPGFEAGAGACKSCEWRTKCWGAADASSEAVGGANEPEPAKPTEDRAARTARRPHRTERQRTDDPVPSDSPVERVSLRTTSGSGDRRKVRRISRGAPEGHPRG